MQQTQTMPSLLGIGRPLCPRCGTRMMLARIEPDEPGHDLRTFECTDCNHYEVVKIRFR